jgi:hypothetical protein
VKNLGSLADDSGPLGVTLMAPDFIRTLRGRQNCLKRRISDIGEALQNFAIRGIDGLVAHDFDPCVTKLIWAPHGNRVSLGNYSHRRD